MNGPRFNFRVLVSSCYILGLTACGGGSEKNDTPVPVPTPVLAESIYSDDVIERLGLDPYVSDTDGDGLKDDYEITYANEYMSPSIADTDENGISDASEDNDNDGLTNLQEQALATSPFLHDSDFDGLSDDKEVTLGTDPLNSDSDKDGLLDGDEVLLGLDPSKADSDGDGIVDLDDSQELTFVSSDSVTLKTDATPSFRKHFSVTVNQTFNDNELKNTPASYQLDIIDLPVDFIEPISLTLNTQSESGSGEVFYYNNSLGLQPVPKSMIDSLVDGSVTVKATAQELVALQSEDATAATQKLSSDNNSSQLDVATTSNSIISSIMFFVVSADKSKAIYDRFFINQNVPPSIEFNFSGTSGHRAINLGLSPIFTNGSHIESSGLLINDGGSVVFSPLTSTNTYSLTLYFDRIDKEGVLLSQENTENLGYYNYIFIDQPSNKPTAVTLVKKENEFSVYLNGKLYQEREASGDIAQYSTLMPITIGKPLVNCDPDNDTTSCANNKQLEGVLLGLEFYEQALSLAEVRKTVRRKYEFYMSDTDSDSDTLSNVDELLGFVIYGSSKIIQTNYLEADTDFDSLNDNEELQGFLNIGSNALPSSKVHGSQSASIQNSSSTAIDYCEGPFLSYECIFYLRTYENTSDPLIADTDSDGISDADEYFLGTNAYYNDSDLDGLLDRFELYLETDPSDPDTDGDGLLDGMEYYLSGEATLPLLDKDVDFGLDPTSTNNINTYEGIEEIKLVISYLINKEDEGFFDSLHKDIALGLYQAQLEKIEQLGMNNFTIHNHFFDGYGVHEFRYVESNNYNEQLALYRKAKSLKELYNDYKLTQIEYGIRKGTGFEAKNSYQAIGQVTGMFVAFVPFADIPATARDITANVLYGRFNDALIDIVSLVPAGDAVKIYDKVVPLAKRFGNNKQFSNVVVNLLFKYASRFTNKQKITIMAALLGADVLNSLMYEGAGSSESKNNSSVSDLNLLLNRANVKAIPLRLTIDEVIAIAKGVDVAKLKNMLDDNSIEVVKAPSSTSEFGAFNGVFHKSLDTEHWKNAQNFVEYYLRETYGVVAKQEVTMTPPKDRKYLGSSEASEEMNKRRDDILVEKSPVYLNDDGAKSIDVETHEVKAGPMSYSKEIRKEIEKDCLRLNAKGRSDQFTMKDQTDKPIYANVQSVTWHFTASGKTSKKVVLGASKRLLEALQCKKYGGKAIKVKAYLPNPGAAVNGISGENIKLATFVANVDDLEAAKVSGAYDQATSTFVNTPIKLDISFGYRELIDSDGDGYDDTVDAFPNDSRYHLDSDNDGMADTWEVLYGLDPNDATDKDLDPDNDELSNLTEFELTLELGIAYSGYDPTRSSPQVPESLSINIKVGDTYQLPLAPLTQWPGKDDSLEIKLLIDTIDDGLRATGADIVNHFGMKVDEDVAEGAVLELTYFVQVQTGEVSKVGVISVSTEQESSLTIKLNDTGITWCADGSNNNLDCPVTGYEGQDAEHGRDAQAKAGTLQKVGGGSGGFDFTKLDANGNDLPESATAWSCVRDNHTGLIWEVKTDDGGLHDKNDRYDWYNPDSNTNGGSPGYQDDDGDICYGYDANNQASYCNTHAYVERVNTQSLCGASDWRMPTRLELMGIVDNGTSPTIDTQYFPQTQSSWFWSSSPGAYSSNGAWSVYFSDGHVDNYGYKFHKFHVRLVRARQ